MSYGVVVSSFVTSGGTAKVTLHYGDLKANTTYAFRTSAYDGSLYETDWSAWAKFKTRGRAVDIKLPEPGKSAPAGLITTDVSANRATVWGTTPRGSRRDPREARPLDGRVVRARR